MSQTEPATCHSKRDVAGKRSRAAHQIHSFLTPVSGAADAPDDEVGRGESDFKKHLATFAT